MRLIDCEWRSSAFFFDVRHVGFSNTYFNIEIDSEIEVAVARP